MEFSGEMQSLTERKSSFVHHHDHHHHHHHHHHHDHHLKLNFSSHLRNWQALARKRGRVAPSPNQLFESDTLCRTDGVPSKDAGAPRSNPLIGLITIKTCRIPLHHKLPDFDTLPDLNSDPGALDIILVSQVLLPSPACLWKIRPPAATIIRISWEAATSY